MLSHEDNELLTLVGPGRPMGTLMRRYWMPALLSDDVAEPDGDPVPVRLLGEDFVGFRDSSGRLGMLADACAHRCASLSYGRNEQGGLRCLYHGWKYDVSGRVLETPNEPEESQLRHKVQQRSLPVVEAGGVVWTYLGDPASAPPFPAPAWAQAPESHRAVARMKLEANYLQVLEGGLDTTHVGILHQSAMASLPEHPVHKTPDLALLKGDTTPRLETQLTRSGFQYAAIRRVDEATNYIRLTSFIMPWYTTVPHFDSVPQQTQGYVPIDDGNTWFWLWWMHDRPIDAVMLKAFQGADPQTGEFEMLGTRANHHLQDRAAMRNESWTGLRGVMAEDSAMTESMGTIVDRSKEHLGMSDAAVIRLRRLLLDALHDTREGKDPPGPGAGLPIGRPYSVAQTCASHESWRDYGLKAEFLD